MIDDLARAIAAAIGRAPAGSPWVLVGIRSRGDELARRVRARLNHEAVDSRVGSLDITLYRDDLSEIGARAIVRTTEIPFDIGGAQVVLLDDVLMTGRSVRAALQELMDLGRPKRVWLGVLVDRGGRELPIAPDFVGLNLSDPAQSLVAPGDTVEVRLAPTDDRDAILVRPAQGKGQSRP